MRTNLDFSPFFRSTVGFDRLFDLIEDASRLTTATSWPTYDIAKTSDDAYRITLAVPGFSMQDIEITQQPNLLVVTGHKNKTDGEVMYRGIPTGDFTHRFELADYVDAVGASLSDGLLVIELKRELPEAMKPRTIAIGPAKPQAQKQLESSQAA